ncbi:protein-disulfide reductase DsbD family protein [Chitinophagaceae bacterium LWZ2-11]
MKKFIIFLICALAVTLGFAQTETVSLKWDVNAKQIEKGVYQISATTKVPQGWHLYGNNTIDGLQSVQFNVELESVKQQGSVQFNKSPEIITDKLFDNKKVNVFTGDITVTETIKIDGVVPGELRGTVAANIGKDDEFAPMEVPFVLQLEGGIKVAQDAQKIKLATVDLAHPAKDCGIKNDVAKSSFLSIFLLGFLGGLIALLTPCVFPMIPVTVSFFTKRAPNKKAAIKNGCLYGFFIFLIYVLASLPFHILGNVRPEIFNNISTSPWLNIIFFIIFIVFAISFFGYFQIQLPSSVASKTDSKSSLGSVGGIFFMALTLAIVSFSCTGPILGSLLVGSLSGGAWPLTFGLGGFGLALALPFGLFAIFPNWLESLPKSGGWLDTVKKVLAFVEVALAFKFLSNADLVMHWGILKREVFVAIWILVGLGLTLYLFGVLRLPHDYKGMKISKGRKAMGVVALLFTLYLIPGVTSSDYARLQLLSGFPPPLSYSVYGKENVHGKGLEANVVNDYDKALQLSKEQHKPILIDFTGWACVNCRKMEENVWTQPEVYNYIKENYILVSLYVDDKEKLPIDKRFTYTTQAGAAKPIVLVGDKWATFQTENFNQSTQPLYVVLNTEEKLMNNPVGYTPSVSEYLNWLKCGKEAFDSK